MSPAALGSRPGGTEAPLAYVFRALDLQNESTAAGAERLPAFANSDGGRLAPALPSIPLPSGRSARPRGGGAVPTVHPGVSSVGDTKDDREKPQH